MFLCKISLPSAVLLCHLLQVSWHAHSFRSFVFSGSELVCFLKFKVLTHPGGARWIAVCIIVWKIFVCVYGKCQINATAAKEVTTAKIEITKCSVTAALKSPQSTSNTCLDLSSRDGPDGRSAGARRPDRSWSYSLFHHLSGLADSRYCCWLLFLQTQGDI